MRRLLKKSLALLLTLTMVFGAAPLAGLVGLELPSLKDIFADKAEAATYGVLTYAIQNGEAAITDCDQSASGDLVIPETIEECPVISISDDAFYNCSGLTSVSIPDSVTSIGDYAFGYCSSFTNATIPNSVTSIGDRAFYGCTGLTSVTILDGVTSIGGCTFGYCSSLTSVTIPDSVTNIGDYVFSSCSNLSNIKIGKGLAEIGINVFVNCYKLNSITVDENNKYYSSDESGVLFNKDKTELIQYPIGNERTEYIIPNSVTSIGDEAFDNCDGLTSVTIPDSVTTIGNHAFYDCTGLTRITVDENNPNYSSDESGVLFNKDKTELIQYPIGNERTEYIIPNSVTSIGNSAFYDCDSLTSVTIPESVTSIGDYAFLDCTKLTRITIPDSVTSIGDGAFYSCTSLTSVTIPDSVTSIGRSAFSNCSELVNIKIGNGIKIIDNAAFSNTGYYNNEKNWVDNVLYIDNCLIESKTDISGEYSIKEGTRIIADRAFKDCRNLTGITVPGSVKYIGSYAYSGCSNLSSVTLENGIVGIDSYAYQTCISLTSISIPDSVEKIGSCAFYGCLNLKTVSIGSGIKSIGQLAFTQTGYYNNEDNWVDNVLYIDNCLIKAKNDTTGEYAVKEGTTVIADYAFRNCNNLANVTIPDSVTTIGYYAFLQCNNLTINSLPSRLTTIGKCAFYGCDKLAINSLPNGLTNIGQSAFAYCDSITCITIPASVTSIGDYAFENCNSLKKTSVDEGNQYYSSDKSGVLFNKDKTELIQYPIGNERMEYIIPDSVTSIGSSAFHGCSNLTKVTIPNSIMSIGDSAFYDCYELTIDSLPSGLTSIGYDAFYNCDELTSVTIPASVTNICSGAFENCDSLVNIYVDEGNEHYSSDEHGVLFNKQKTELIQYPIGNDRTEYIIPDSVISMGNSAFKGCNCLTNIIIPASIRRICDNTFTNCKSLSSVTIPNSVTYIGEFAFGNCESLTTVTIPASVTYIWSSAFFNCSNLESFFVDESNKYYSSDNFGVLFNKDKTELILYPVGNTRTSYTVPETVQTIGSNSFYNCKNLVSITIPKSVSSIYWDAFDSCDNLNTVYYSGSPSMWNEISIDSGNDKLKNATIIYAEEDSESGETVEAKKETVSDESTDVSVEYILNFHEGEVGLEVERTFDGKAFDVISTHLDINSNEIYDIKMTIDGVATQPNGKVKVKIPIPAGYDPAKTFVYHVNTNTGTVENMNAVVDGNYLVFETDHFSYYAVVEVKDSAPDEPVEQSYKITWNVDGKITEQKYKAGDVITAPQNPVKSGYRFVGWSPAVPATMPAYDLTFTAVFEKLSSPVEDRLTVSIRTPSTASVDYGDSIILHLDIDKSLPDGAYIEWSESNGNFDMSVSADGTTCKISPKSSGKTVFTATVYDKDGNVISSDTQEMNAKAGLWQKIVAFFKKIFGLTKTFPEAFKGIL